jgi:hypothetical protein
MTMLHSVIDRLRRALINHASRTMLPLLVLLVAMLGPCVASPATAAELHQSGTVQIKQVQIAWIGSANLGGGSVQYGGQSWRFTIGGLGIGGFGISEITATGEVYNLSDIAYFPGAYLQARAGFAIGNVSAGELWLQNSNGVVLHLKADRVGLALSLGGDAIYIRMD